MIEDLPYRIRRSDRARRVRVSVDAHGAVEVVLPRRTPASAAPAAIEELRPWIERRLHAATALRATIAARGATLPYLGEQLTLTPQAGRTRAHRAQDALLVPAEADAAQLAIERWYRRAAAREIAPRLDVAAAALGTSYTTLSIRAQRTRWGSCSSTGAMSFNWRLLLAPAEILDYVVEHEVAHLEVRDHSRRFWRLLAGRCPDYRQHEAWLKRHGPSLRL